MKNLPKVNEIVRRANKLGMSLNDIAFQGEGIKFVYDFGDRTVTLYYTSTDKGIMTELTRINKLLRAEKSLTTET